MDATNATSSHIFEQPYGVQVIVPAKKDEIRSFSAQVFQKVRESNFFNPSDYELRPIQDKGSLTESLLNVDLFRTRKITTWSHTLTKPLRTLAYYAAMLAIGAFVAPVGVLYNGGNALLYTAKAICGGESSQAN